MSFGLCFAPSATAAVTLSSPPAVHLAGPEAGSIAMMIGQPEFAPVVLRDAHAPLAGLWLWSMAVAWDLLPVTLRLEAEEGPVELSAQPQADGQILVVVARGHAKAARDKDRVQGIRWQQTRAEFLRHWGSAWTKCLASPAFDAGGHWAIDPEPVRDMPWVTLGETPELEAPSWPMPARIAWFYLQMAHHSRSKNHGCEYTADPARWVARELAFARMGVQCANAAWAALHSTPAPNQGEEARIAVVLARAQQLPKELSRELEVSLHHDYIETQSAAFEHVARVAEALLPQLPITPGCHFADEKGRRSTLVYRHGRRWTLWREDGMLVQEDAFRARFHTLWRWPVAYGPHFDPERLDGIDRRRLRFFCCRLGLGASSARCAATPAWMKKMSHRPVTSADLSIRGVSSIAQRRRWIPPWMKRATSSRLPCANGASGSRSMAMPGRPIMPVHLTIQCRFRPCVIPSIKAWCASAWPSGTPGSNSPTCTSGPYRSGNAGPVCKTMDAPHQEETKHETA